MRKLQPDIVLLGSRLARTGGSVLKPRVRLVTAQPQGDNILMAKVSEVNTHLRKLRTNSNSGRIDEAVLAYPDYKYHLAADYAGFDEHIGWQTELSYNNNTYIPIMDAMVAQGALTHLERDKAIDSNLASLEMDLLSPPFDMKDGAVLLSAKGGLDSGKRSTSDVGTEVCREARLAKMELMGIKGEVFNLGDDTLLMSNDVRLRDEWFDYASFAELEETDAADVTYLMTRIPHGYRYIARMCSIDSEPQHEPRSVIHAALRYRARHDLLKGHPLQTSFFDILSGVGPERFNSAIALARGSTLNELFLLATAVDANAILDDYEYGSLAVAATEAGVNLDFLSTAASILRPTFETFEAEINSAWSESTSRKWIGRNSYTNQQ